jgi:light-regulated signal transduction histidine kinase (bacteriophytochrome)
MSERINGFRREYISALETYLEAGDETALSHAYELGRRAMIDGLGVLDMAVLHRAAVKSLVVPAPPGDRAQVADAAANFFDELLSPFEMSFRGYRSANDELQQLNETLRTQKEAVEDINRELESFSYSVSHDLRAPLRSIDGFSQILVEELAERLGDEGKKYLQYIRETTQRMGELIDDLLGLARVTRTDIHRTDVDLSALARDTVHRLQVAAPQRRVSITIQEGVRANGDARLLAVVLENLLGNAWKFTAKREHASISFGCEQRGGVPTYFIRDNGAGFDMMYAAKLFGAFQRLHSPSEFEGTGIGLATVQRIVRRHGGRVSAEGQVEGGATFFFTLSGGRRT